jgi:hypothetical protein
MIDPLVMFPLATAVFGMWELVDGRPLRGSKRWPLNRRATRWGGAYTFAGGLLAVALVLTHHSAIAFMTYAVMVLAFAGTIQLTRMRRAKI